jgi:membrane protein DedA with SNARE-associated domain
MRRKLRKFCIFLLICLILVLGIISFNYIDPQEIVAKLGVKNGYLIVFFLGILGGASAVTGPSYFIAISTLMIGGLNPFILILVGGLGLTTGDIIILFLGLKAGKKSPERFKEKIEKLNQFLEKRPKKVIPLIVYAYIGFTPFPNELVTIPLGLTGYQLKKIIPIILLGNITSGLIFALAGFYGLKHFNI